MEALTYFWRFKKTTLRKHKEVYAQSVFSETETKQPRVWSALSQFMGVTQPFHGRRILCTGTVHPIKSLNVVNCC